MKALNTVFPLILTALLVAAACGDDDDDKNGNPGAGGGAMCKGTFVNLTEEQVKKGRHTVGACISDTDVKSVCVNDVSAGTQSCALTCLPRGNTTEERLACTRTCLPSKLTVEPKPSTACQECYV